MKYTVLEEKLTAYWGQLSVPERLVYQASYVEMEPRIGLQGFSYYLRDIYVYPDQRAQ